MGELANHVFLMDRTFSVMTLQCPRRLEQRYPMKDLCMILKGTDFVQKMPTLAKYVANCLALVFEGDEGQLIFHFDDSSRRDHFYTCLKILRMSVDINSARLAAKRDRVKR